jgi:hypothetical protein
MAQAENASGGTLYRVQGAVGGVLVVLFIALSFDLSVPWLILSAAVGAGLGATVAPLGAEAHPAVQELPLLRSASASDAAPAATAGFYRLSGFVLLSYAVGSLCWRVFTQACEWESRLARTTTIGLDVLVIAGVIAIRRHVPRAVFWITLVAAIGLLAIRVTETGWRTGHLTYELSPR